jgi:hypothetical protein
MAQVLAMILEIPLAQVPHRSRFKIALVNWAAGWA